MAKPRSAGGIECVQQRKGEEQERWNNNLSTSCVKGGEDMKSEASLSKIGKFQVTSMGYWGCGLFTQLKVWSRTVAQRRVWRERSAGTWEERPAQRSNATTATAWNGIAPWHDPLAFWPTDRPPPASSRRPLRCRRCRCSPRSVGRSVGRSASIAPNKTGNEFQTNSDISG